MKLDFLNKLKLKWLIDNKGIGPLVIILFCSVLVLMMTSNGAKTSNNHKDKSVISNSSRDYEREYQKELEKQLKSIILEVKGINNASVMITLKSSTEKIILKDVPYSKENSKEEQIYSNEEETVIVEDTEGKSCPYVVKTINPKVEGVVIGIDNNQANIKQEIIDIVQALFDVSVHKIKIVNIK